nr:hypothetical protein GCM10020092_020060 [Actinoplanes digitatis]
MTDEPIDEPIEGDRVEVTVGAPAHGGHCVARIGGPHGRVVFVRHALPGERVTVELTELHKGYLRGDAVDVHEASADRVAAPCAFAHPGGCGGCDLQHVAPDAQLRWKAAVVRELLGRMGGLSTERIDELDVRVRPLPGGPLGWRSRVRYAVDAAGRPGLLQHRSHQVVPVDRCLIARPELQKLEVTARLWPDAAAVEVVASTGGDVSVLSRPAGAPALDPAAAADPLVDEDNGGAGVLVDGPAEIRELAAGREWLLPPDGFWQVHPAAADTLVTAVLELLRLGTGRGLLGPVRRRGPLRGRALRADRRADHRRRVVAGRGGRGAPQPGRSQRRRGGGGPGGRGAGRRRITAPVDLVVLDPPRAGAGAKVVRAIAAARPRAVAYVACDPAALSRDVQTFAAEGWRLAELRAYDCFPMTQHIECVALLLPDD